MWNHKGRDVDTKSHIHLDLIDLCWQKRQVLPCLFFNRPGAAFWEMCGAAMGRERQKCPFLSMEILHGI